MNGNQPETLVKSRKRVADHGEVFTPAWLVEGMLDLVKGESERIDSRFLEPACGSGNFLIPVLRRKLATVQARYAKSSFERRHQGLLGLMCVYGIELLADNAKECRERLVQTFDEFVATDGENEHARWHRAAVAVANVNIVQGDALAMTTASGAPITFHVYDGATHCWDCKFADGHSRIDIRGNKVSYRYDEAATRDTVERIFTFFAKVAAEAKDRKPDK